MVYAEKVKSAREKLLLTQEDLAAALGVNAVTICRWETGKSVPSIRAQKVFRDYCKANGLTFGNDND